MASSGSEAPPVRKDGLQLVDDRRFQEVFWTVERGAWIGFGLLVLVSLAGLTGAGGPLSHATVATGGGRIDYPTVARWQASEDLTIEFAAGDGQRSLTLSPSFFESFQIETIQPEPERSDIAPEGHRLTFQMPGGSPGSVKLHVRPADPGPVRFQAALDGAAPASLFTLVLP